MDERVVITSECMEYAALDELSLLTSKADAAPVEEVQGFVYLALSLSQFSKHVWCYFMQCTNFIHNDSKSHHHPLEYAAVAVLSLLTSKADAAPVKEVQGFVFAGPVIKWPSAHKPPAMPLFNLLAVLFPK
jgi:hypothetical protein